MKDLRDEVPKRAFINAEIIQLAETTQGFRDSVDAIKRKYAISEYQFMNQAYIVSLLYCLLVVPKEIWLGRRREHEIYPELEKRESLKRFTVEASGEGFARNPVYSLIHALRNSVAHARFSVDSNMSFVFWDQREADSPPHFRASISANDLMAFLSEVGSLLANLQSFR